MAHKKLHASEHTDGTDDIQSANASQKGIVDTTAQTFAGTKTFQDGIGLTPVPASDDTGSGLISTMTVDVNISGVGAPLHLDVDGNWIEVDVSGTIPDFPCQALALETGTGFKKVLHIGFLRNDDWDWTPGGAIFIDTINGDLTQTPDKTSGSQIQKLGYATHADRVFFNPDFTIIETA